MNKVRPISRILFLTVCVLFLSGISASAQVSSETRPETISLKVAFRQGKRQIDRSYMNNSANIYNFTSTLQGYLYDSNIEVESVDIIGGASIEGSAELNEDLSNNRAARMVEILREYASVPQNKVHVNSRGVNWEDVIEMVESDYGVPSREEVLNILRNTPEASRKAALQKLDGTRPYMYMYEHIFPYVRTGKMTVTFRLVPKAPVKAAAPAEPGRVDTVYVHQRDTVYHVYIDDPNAPKNINQNILNVNTDRYGRRRGRPSYGEAVIEYKPSRLDRLDTLLRVPILAVRSNLLLPLLNVGVEIPLGNRWSISGDWNYPWVWRLPDHKDCFEFHGGTGEVRYWFGRRHAPGDKNKKYRLLGHSIALVGGSGCYDFQKDWAGFQGEYGAAGIDYQYAMPLGRRGRAHLEFDLTLGAITSRNIPYDVFSEGGVLLHRDGLIETFSWYGPIKGGVSLAVPIYKKTVYDKMIQAENKQMKAEAKAAGKLAAEQEAEMVRAEKAAASQMKADAKTQAEQAKADSKAQAKQAKADAKAQAEQAKADAKAQAKQAKADSKAQAKQAKVDSKAQAEQAKADAKAQAEQEKAEAKAAKKNKTDKEASL